MSKKTRRNGFAMIEIVVVVLIVGLLAAWGWAAVNNGNGSPTAATGLNAIEQAQQATEQAVQNARSEQGAVDQAAGVSGASSSGPAAASSATHAAIDIHAIPLGDGKISTAPKVGYVYSCEQSFNGGGAEHAGDWIGTSTWDLTKKISVEGSVTWPSAAFSAAVQGSELVLSGNGLPVGAITGIFPIQSIDPAYQYDRNPNSIQAYNVSYQLPANPTIATSASCVPMGAIGYTLNGVAIYNALDASGRDAVAHEVQDACDGHPQGAGQYHYHGPSPCMPNTKKNNALVGYALDGFGIYSMYDASGREYTDADLDACHGTTSLIEWNGKEVSMYHYVLTREYPYTVGCFRGTPVTQVRGAAGTSSGTTGGSQPGGSPPPAAISACSGRSSGVSCSFSGAQGTVSGICRVPPGQTSLACVPQ